MICPLSDCQLKWLPVCWDCIRNQNDNDYYQPRKWSESTLDGAVSDDDNEDSSLPSREIRWGLHQMVEAGLAAQGNKIAKIIFLSHPYRDDPEGNLARCTELCRRLAKAYPDVVIFSPLHAFGWLGEDQRDRIMDYCRRAIDVADEVWLAPGWESSEGCRQEVEWAREQGKMVVNVLG